MKNLRKITLALFIGAASFSTLFTSCNNDPCKDIQCDNGGVCTEGSCDCPAGYEGANCETLSKTKFINAAGWNVTEDGTSSAADNYDVNITSNSSVTNGVYISNVWNTFTNTVNATVVGNTITIARQAPITGVYVEGSGTIDTTLNPDRITMKYKVTDETGVPITTDDFGLISGSASIWIKK